ncbi:photoreceptor cilium actin regulator [Syngnathus typhle]|uniref:photoreceptor cilium actin regulator n=1 Tax=Syngnathus typhle TaxID=161592 RepID=UPI002A6B3AC8|nr:photoreceptor cilium actin regulator [Syngnathus typhle]
MGCSPSKGNNFVTLGSLRRGRMLPAAPNEQPREAPFKNGDDHKCPGVADGNTKDKNKTSGPKVFQSDGNTPAREDPHATVPAPEVINTDTFKNRRTDGNTVMQKKDKNRDKQEEPEKKSGKKTRRCSRGLKVLKKKEKEMAKIDFPEPLVKAHQAAYAFLNPSINKYDFVLGLLEQATQTQTYLQPMVSFMALRFEEIVRALEEIVDEGEKMLKENGEHLSWPNPTRKLSSAVPSKSAPAIEQPPDLLQQLLQYTTQRMQNVSQTVGGIGDSALEDAVEYFSSISELLEEKLKVKRGIETRIMQLASRIELASLRRLGPEDSALFSEDSGIGAESESLAGSEKHQRRVSCESSGTNTTTPFSPVDSTSMTGVPVNNRAHQQSPSGSLHSLNSLASMCTMMANVQGDSLLGSVSLDDAEEDDDDEMDSRKGQQSNSSLEQQKPRRLPTKRIENSKNVEMTIKMKNAISGKIHFAHPPSAGTKPKVVGSPKRGRSQRTGEKGPLLKRSQTTARRNNAVKTTALAQERRSRSAESLRGKDEDPTLLELGRSQKKIGQRLQKINKSKETTKGNRTTLSSTQNQRTSPSDSPKINQRSPSLEKEGNLRERGKCITKSTRETSNAEQNDRSTSLVEATPPPSPPTSPRPLSGLYRGRNSVRKLIDTFSQGIEEMDSPKVLGPLRGVRKCGVPVLPGLGSPSAFLSTGQTRSRSTPCEKTEHLDLDNLPPPPLEVLMDNSFERASEGAIKSAKSPTVKGAALSQRLRASVISGPVLPSKGGVPHCSKRIFPVGLDHQVSATQTDVSQPDAKTDLNNLKDKKSSLLQQVRRNRYRRHSSDSFSNDEAISQSVSQEYSRSMEENDRMPGGTSVSQVPPSSEACSHPHLLSKGRILPSTPSSSSNSCHRRLPSPRNLKKSPTPPSSASPPVNRELTTPSESPRSFPRPAASKHNLLNSSYPFKAPSPPASPKVQRWSRENSTEESSRLTSNARSVFCPISPSLFEAQPRIASKLSQAWTSVGGSFLSNIVGKRGRCSVSVQGPQPFIRRSLSERRPSLNFPPQSPVFSVAETCGSEPAICTQGLHDEAARKEESWGSQWDLRATLRSASHPDLYVVGQALCRD